MADMEKVVSGLKHCLFDHAALDILDVTNHCNGCPYYTGPECERDLYYGALELLKEQEPTVSGWVSVKDRLPEDTKQKIVFHKRGVSFAHFSGNCWWSSIGGRHGLDTVTHWMQLPEPPKEEA